MSFGWQAQRVQLISHELRLESSIFGKKSIDFEARAAAHILRVT
jgi:hypothetical protein